LIYIYGCSSAPLKKKKKRVKTKPYKTTLLEWWRQSAVAELLVEAECSCRVAGVVEAECSCRVVGVVEAECSCRVAGGGRVQLQSCCLAGVVEALKRKRKNRKKKNLQNGSTHMTRGSTRPRPFLNGSGSG
jgi:hypothetical protein